MAKPWVTCLCPTYGRFERLQDAIACFLLQDYRHKRLMILNDAPRWICHAVNFWMKDGIRHGAQAIADNIYVENREKRYETLGHKRQALLEMANTRIVAHWDDDDLYLPWHLSRLIKEYQKTDAQCVKPADAWWVCGPQGSWDVKGPKHNQFEGQMLFDRERALKPFQWRRYSKDEDAPGGYPPMVSGQALALMKKFRYIGRYHEWKQGPAGISYCYRWRDKIGHISGLKPKAKSHADFARLNRDFGEGPLIPDEDPLRWARKRMKPVFEELASALSEKLMPHDLATWCQRMAPYMGEAHAHLDRTHADRAGTVHERGSPIRLTPLQPPAE